MKKGALPPPVASRRGQDLTGRFWLLALTAVFGLLALQFVLADLAPILRGPVSRGQVVGRDFITEWSGARLFLSGRTLELFDPARYQGALRELWDLPLAVHYFSYPPTILPLTAWTGLMPYPWALAAWSALGVLLLSFGSGLWKRPLDLACALLSPATLVCLESGQSGLITSGLLLWGWTLLDRRPFLAGAVMGLASFKPQVGLLVPVALAAMGQWRALVGGGVAVAGLGIVSLGMAGPDAWREYATLAIPHQNRIFGETFGGWEAMSPSPLLTGLRLGLGTAGASILQAAVTAAAAILVFRMQWRRRTLAPREMVIFFAASALASPYSLNYDLPALSASLVLALRVTESATARLAVGTAILWSAPLLMMLAWGLMTVLLNVDLPLGSLVIALGLACFAIARTDATQFASSSDARA